MQAARRAGSRRGLQPGELAAAATMAAVCIGLYVLGSLLPQLGSLQLVTVVPFAIVTHRHGLRALAATFVAAAVVAGLVAGLGSAVGLAGFATIGGVVGEIKRRGRGVGTLWAAAAVLAPLAAGLLDLLLFVFASSRRLVFENVRSTLRGLGSVLRHLAPVGSVTADVNHAVATIIGHWAIFIALVAAGATVAVLLISWVLVGEVLDRLRWVGTGHLSGPDLQPEEDGAAPAPVPVALRSISFRYGQLEALSDVELTIPAGEFIAVVGDNGSGKSTLARLLAGASPSSGAIDRPGPVGLGRRGGTALIGQRPDAQVLGLRVRDDVLWGLPPDHGVDVGGLLETVGLAGMAERDTASLSGGQLQRVAVAAALARDPQLLISDESTAMVDPAGRAELVRLFAELPRRRPMTVVHITHNEEEVRAADRVIRLEHGRLATSLTAAEHAAAAAPGVAPPASAAAAPGVARPAAAESVPVTVSAGGQGPGRVSLDGLGHSYAYGTVWEHSALNDLTLSIEPGEGVLIVGENGSGKSTLAWILAGLIRPTAGGCLIDGVPSHRLRGAVGLAFQHARLQLQRPTVAAEIADAAGWSGAAGERAGARHESGDQDPPDRRFAREVADALRAVGLDPGLAERSIEQLSGGQQRRVAIAGLLARGPRVLVLDEPLAGLDAPARSALGTLLADLRRNAGLTLIVVTHDPEALHEICPRTVRLERGRVAADSGTCGPAAALAARAA